MSPRKVIRSCDATETCCAAAPSMNRSTSPSVIASAGRGKKVSAFSAAAGLDKTALFETGQNQFKKLLRNLLS